MTQKIVNIGTADKGDGDPIRTAFSKVNDNFTELYAALGLDELPLNLGSFEFTGNTITTTDSSIIILDQSVTINSELTMKGDIVPDLAGEHNLGSLAKPWNSLYVSGSTIYLGGAALQIDNAGELTINNNPIVQQNGQYIDLNLHVRDVNVSNPQPGDTLQWGPGYWINVPSGITNNIESETDIAVKINLTDSTQRIWTFTEGGDLRFPDGTTQTTAYTGFHTGDVKGSVFADDSTLLVDAVGGVIPAGVLSGTINNDIETGLLRTSERLISLGYQSGGGQGTDAIAIGAEAALGGHGAYSIAIGSDAGSLSGDYVIAIGKGAGDGTADNCITIGREATSLFSNSIVLNATSGALSAGTNGLFIKPITGGEFDTFLQWDPVSGQVGANSYLFFSDSTRQYTAFTGTGYLTFDDAAVRGTSDYQYTFNTDGYFTSSTSSESPNYFFVANNTTNQNIAAGWTVVGANCNTTVSSTQYPVPGYPNVIKVTLTAPASGTFGFYPVVVSDPNRLKVQIQPNPGNASKYTFATTGLTFPDATVQTTAYTGIARNIESENDVSIRVNLTDSTQRVWSFGEDGDLILPGALTTNGYVKALGPTDGIGNGDNLTIQAGETVTGDGGDLTVHAGDTVTGVGGDLTVRSGAATTGNAGVLNVRASDTVTGDGGMLNIRAGDAVTGDAGDIDVRAGDAITGDGGSITITAGSTVNSGPGGSVTITSGSNTNGAAGDISLVAATSSAGADGVINLTTAVGSWTFNDNGQLDLGASAGGIFANQSTGKVSIADYMSGGSPAAPSKTLHIGGPDYVAQINGYALSNPPIWTFGNDRSLEIPGDIRSENAINIDINLSDSTLRRWTFGEDGDLTFPDSTVQSTAFTGNATALVNGSYSISAEYNGIDIKAPLTWKENNTDRVVLNYITLDNRFVIGTNVAGVTKAFYFGDNGNFTIPGNITFPDASVQTTAWTGTLTVNDSGLTVNGGTGTIYQGPSGALQVGDKKGGVYHAASTSSNGLFTFGMNGGGIMSAAVEGSLFVGSSMPSNNGGVTTAYGGWLVVQNGGKFGTDVDTLGNVILGKGVFEKFQAKQDATGTVEHDCLNGHIFYHTSPDANWTANFTNLNIATSYATSVSIVIAQGGTGYYPNAVQIGGVAQTINWQGNVNPTPSTNRTDVVTFSILNNSGTYTVLGQLTGF